MEADNDSVKKVITDVLAHWKLQSRSLSQLAYWNTELANELETLRHARRFLSESLDKLNALVIQLAGDLVLSALKQVRTDVEECFKGLENYDKYIRRSKEVISVRRRQDKILSIQMHQLASCFDLEVPSYSAESSESSEHALSSSSPSSSGTGSVELHPLLEK